MELVEGVVTREVRHVRGLVSLAILHEGAGALSVAQRCFGFALLEAPRDYEALIGMLYVAVWPGVCLSVWVVGGWELMLRCLYRDRVCGWFTECACRDDEGSDSATRQEPCRGCAARVVDEPYKGFSYTNLKLLCRRRILKRFVREQTECL